MGGGEWVREGLRKPWVIDRYLFVNGVRVGARRRAGRTTRSRSTRSRGAASSRPRRGLRCPPLTVRAIPPSRASRSRSGPPSRPRPAARSSASSAPSATPSAPTSASGGWSGGKSRRRDHRGPRRDGEAGRPPTGGPRSWSDPGVRVGHLARTSHAAVRRHRRGEARAGDPPRAPRAATRARGSSRGPCRRRRAVFEGNCAACHGREAAWPISDRLRGRSRPSCTT